MIQKKLETPAFNDGVVRIFSAENTADPGRKPDITIKLKETLRYEERMVGAHRFYTALQTNTRISHVLRMPLRRNVSTQDIAIPNDGQQYRIVQIQYPPEYPVMDLTLERMAEDL